MINLTRTAEPAQLTRNKVKQLLVFLTSGKERPHSYQYASQPILNELCAISFYKCYYCERKLSGDPKEVDHFIEISCDRNRALDWDNLFLSCESCNNKMTHLDIPVTDALNPFLHTNAQIEDNLAFEREVIRPRNGSILGANTIKKYKLNSEPIELWRARFLTKFFDELTELDIKCRSEGNRVKTADEIENLLKYSYVDHPFSLMFKMLLRRKGLL